MAYLPDTPRPRQDVDKHQTPATDAAAPEQASSAGTTRARSAEGPAAERALEQAPAPAQVGNAAGLAQDVRQVPHTLSSPSSPSSRTAT